MSKISACNVLDGTVAAIHQGPTTSHVEITVQGIKLIASMTNESVKALNLKEGMPAHAVINPNDVLLLVD
ncbi:TOBE domain-containing protein [Beijerinckia indica]|uniref:TOBE domain protein n=1 Tax=Beijerinckia indica subsp. indica (strain ATCC 9039 / DSM 1715 / NCIMB 8712) TaxID=395963 RepID=B2ID75_BEII9|nr:TOBE domain-containing protein [Beijerinckia indica]ACB93932.1 TOBE domain protein [Beijerinckia indica subsp. indica ATCC 9039]